MHPPRLVAIALAAAALAACGGVARPAPGDAGSLPSPGPDQTAVTYNGLRVLVPADWPRNALICGMPSKDTVVVDPGPQPACIPFRPPTPSYVWLRSTRGPGSDAEAAVATNRISLRGHAAMRGEDTLPDGRTRDVVLLTGRNTLLVAVSADPTLARALADSATAV